jgi:2,4-dienoyl-CoA reductase-like NADH-dependent reductase (Old Yellow Enzyme family)
MATAFEQAKLGPIELKNRIIKAATFEGRAPKGAVTQDLIDFHLAVAEGGIGMTTVAYLAVAPEGRTDRNCVLLSDPANIEPLQRLTATIHDAGAKANTRTDQYGGSLEKRSIYPRKVVEAVREEIGDRIALTAKISMRDATKGGIELEHSIPTAKLLESDGNLDALVLTAGSSLNNPMYLFRGHAPRKEFAETLPQPLKLGFKVVGRRFMPDYPYEEAYFLDMASQFRAELTMPLVLLGGISNAETIERGLGAGFEFVAMGRALLAEPDLLLRYQAGTASTSQCSHCNRCMVSIYSGTRCTESFSA